VEFGVLGPLEITAGGLPIGLAGARARAVLAMLLVHGNQVVPADRLTQELWRDRPRAADSLQVRLSELRKALRSAGEADRLVTRPPGYLLQVRPGELDALRFEQLAAEGNAALARGDPATDAGSLLATFDAPGRAIRCADALLGQAAALGVHLGAGIHTGEVDLAGDAITGISVQIAGRLAALARPAEILVSRTVKDLVTGSGISFTERGSHLLDGGGESWPLFAVAGRSGSSPG
jgi:class 3 adenylate cyclase